MRTSKRFSLSTTQVILLSFLLLILVGSVLLALPVSAADGVAVPYIDALFTATTATCVTGLVTVITATEWSVFGQMVILLLCPIRKQPMYWKRKFDRSWAGNVFNKSEYFIKA